MAREEAWVDDAKANAQDTLPIFQQPTKKEQKKEGEKERIAIPLSAQKEKIEDPVKPTQQRLQGSKPALPVRSRPPLPTPPSIAPDPVQFIKTLDARRNALGNSRINPEDDAWSDDESVESDEREKSTSSHSTDAPESLSESPRPEPTPSFREKKIVNPHKNPLRNHKDDEVF